MLVTMGTVLNSCTCFCVFPMFTGMAKLSPLRPFLTKRPTNAKVSAPRWITYVRTILHSGVCQEESERDASVLLVVSEGKS